ncbi:succinate dehydrogenase assembly factor 4, mitochondrial [Denticeps clupeoides]|uniref:Succinate dehydrogenase assembly factor 4, mitochondrial n=1 Tax=Denticeps clupeoides TaxID=299321 RepID=A0AAY4D6G2_9TELE|nr:succinate dehydrogenase assembly factor 4, mitochondrial [Denticeps clupeoides]
MALWCATGRLLTKGAVAKVTFPACSRPTSRVAEDKEPLRKAKTPQGRFDVDEKETAATKDVLERFPDDVNPYTKEKGGPRGPEPTRYGDWERKGRCIDF